MKFDQRESCKKIARKSEIREKVARKSVHIFKIENFKKKTVLILKFILNADMDYFNVNQNFLLLFY